MCGFYDEIIISQMKVGSNPASDLRRGMIIRSVIDDPANLPAGYKPRDPKTLVGKNAGPTGNVLMIDANQASNRLDFYDCADSPIIGLGRPPGDRIREGLTGNKAMVYMNKRVETISSHSLVPLKGSLKNLLLRMIYSYALFCSGLLVVERFPRVTLRFERH